MPIHNCREFLEFPPVIHTGQGDSPNELLYFTLAQYQLKIMCSFLSTIDCQENNFHAQILESCFLKQSILSTEPLDGQYDGLEILRFKTPYLHNQTGFNNEAYKGFLIYNRIERFDQERPHEMKLQCCDLKNTENLFFLFQLYQTLLLLH